MLAVGQLMALVERVVPQFAVQGRRGGAAGDGLEYGEGVSQFRPQFVDGRRELAEDGRQLLDDALGDGEGVAEVLLAEGLVHLFVQFAQYLGYFLQAAMADAAIGPADHFEGAFQQLIELFPRIDRFDIAGKARFEGDGEITVRPGVFPDEGDQLGVIDVFEDDVGGEFGRAGSGGGPLFLFSDLPLGQFPAQGQQCGGEVTTFPLAVKAGALAGAGQHPRGADLDLHLHGFPVAYPRHPQMAVDFPQGLYLSFFQQALALQQCGFTDVCFQVA